VSSEQRRGWIEWQQPALSITRQCELVGVPRSTVYYEPVAVSVAELELMRRLDAQYTQTPFYGSRRMTAWLHTQGYVVNRKRVTRLLALLGLEAIVARRRLSTPAPGHRIYPYLLRSVPIERVNHVWSTDITYIRLRRGFAYLVAVLDWYSRYVLAWELAPTLDTEFCVTALEAALRQGRPEIFNSDQGAQFTSAAFTGRLEAAGVRISMDGRGRALDNVFVERLWRSVKYEEVYLKDYAGFTDAARNLAVYFRFYNRERLHQALGYRTPAAVYRPAS
jgi:putative transposase